MLNCAPGITPPFWSATVPEMVAVVCAEALTAPDESASIIKNKTLAKEALFAVLSNRNLRASGIPKSKFSIRLNIMCLLVPKIFATILRASNLPASVSGIPPAS